MTNITMTTKEKVDEDNNRILTEFEEMTVLLLMYPFRYVKNK